MITCYDKENLPHVVYSTFILFYRVLWYLYFTNALLLEVMKTINYFRFNSNSNNYLTWQYRIRQMVSCWVDGWMKVKYWFKAVVPNCWDVYRCRDLKDLVTGQKIFILCFLTSLCNIVFGLVSVQFISLMPKSTFSYQVI